MTFLTWMESFSFWTSLCVASRSLCLLKSENPASFSISTPPGLFAAASALSTSSSSHLYYFYVFSSVETAVMLFGNLSSLLYLSPSLSIASLLSLSLLHEVLPRSFNSENIIRRFFSEIHVRIWGSDLRI